MEAHSIIELKIFDDEGIVITIAKQEKIISMEEGINNSGNEVIGFSDGDIYPYPVATIKKSVQFIVCGVSDFVKPSFPRNAGRVGNSSYFPYSEESLVSIEPGNNCCTLIGKAKLKDSESDIYLIKLW